MAIALAKKNIDVILTYNSKKEEAENVVQEIEKLGAKAAAIQLNVAEVKTFDSFVESIKAILKNNFQTENFDILVNNAGIGIHKSFAETTEEEFDKLKGIGKVFSARIVTFRNKLGGFYSIEQLKDVYGIEDSVFQKFKKNLRIKPINPKKININEASFEELTANPYFFTTVAKQIIGYRNVES